MHLAKASTDRHCTTTAPLGSRVKYLVIVAPAMCVLTTVPTCNLVCRPPVYNGLATTPVVFHTRVNLACNLCKTTTWLHRPY